MEHTPKKKSLGQHFLHDTQVIESIVDASLAPQGSHIVEIGPGDGALTQTILQQGYTVTAIETDQRMIKILEQTFKNELDNGTLKLHHTDIRDWQPPSTPYHVIANIPYYITGLIMRLLLTATNQPQSMTLVMQREVAQRICRIDTKHSLLSLSVQCYGSPRIARTIGSGAFSPPPQVESAVLVVDTINRKQFHTPHHEQAFFNLIKAGFTHKRKTLNGNLKRAGIDAAPAISHPAITEHTRAEDVSLETWIELAARYVQ